MAISVAHHSKQEEGRSGRGESSFNTKGSLARQRQQGVEVMKQTCMFVFLFRRIHRYRPFQLITKDNTHPPCLAGCLLFVVVLSLYSTDPFGAWRLCQ